MDELKAEINELRDMVSELEEKTKLQENKIKKITKALSLHSNDLESAAFTLNWLNTQIKDLVKDI